MGKKIGIVAMVCTVIFITVCIIAIIEAPEIPEEVFELMLKDKEAAMEKMEEIENNSSALYKITDEIAAITGLGGIVLAILSLVKMSKEKQKGKVIPILCIILIIVFYIITIFITGNLGTAFQAGLNAGMEMQN